MEQPEPLVKELVYSLDISTYFPRYRELEALHSKFITKEPYAGVGPTGVFGDIIKWVMEGIRLEKRGEDYYNLTVPELIGNNKRGKHYEELFIETALQLWAAMPVGLKGIFPVHFKLSNAVFVIVYEAKEWTGYEYVASIKPEVFYRRNKKVQKMGDGTRVWVVPKRTV